MPELIPLMHAGEILERFKRLGHVGIAHVYPPELAHMAICELELIAEPYEAGVDGERKATISNVAPSPDRPNATAVLAGIGHCAELLGVSLWPLSEGTSIIDLIRMEPGTRGAWHRDGRTLVQLVAIATIQGTSELRFEDGVYALTPGHVVFHNPESQLWHQGIASSKGERVGIVIAKEPPNGDVRSSISADVVQ